MALESLGTVALESGQHACLAVKGKKLAVANLSGKFFALDNACTHAGGPLCEGKLGEKDAFSVTCPWHGSQFDYRNGKVLRGPALKPVKSYAMKEKGGELFVEI